MARSTLTMPVAGVALSGIAAGLILPRLLKASRTAARSIGATIHRSGPPGVGRAGADPAQGRPA